MASIHCETSDGVTIVTLANDGKRNAITAEMWRQLPPLLSALGSDHAVRMLVLRGAGTDFSAGVDISEVEQVMFGKDRAGGALLTEAEDALAEFPKPTLAAIDGYCVGGGWELAAACDIRVASTRALFGVTPARLGILYPLSGLRRLVQITGPGPARHLLLTGELVDADTAARWGMITRVIDTDNFWTEIAALTAAITSRSLLSQAASSELIDLISADDPTLQDRAAHWDSIAAHSDESRIGIDAFFVRTPPHFTWTIETGNPRRPTSS